MLHSSIFNGFLSNSKAKMIHIKPQNVGAGFARPNVLGAIILCMSIRFLIQRKALNIKLRLANLHLTVWAVHRLDQFWRSRQYLQHH